MKDIINNVLLELSHKNISMDTNFNRDMIAEKILQSFQDKNIVFYTNLEKHNKEKIERGL